MESENQIPSQELGGGQTQEVVPTPIEQPTEPVVPPPPSEEQVPIVPPTTEEPKKSKKKLFLIVAMIILVLVLVAGGVGAYFLMRNQMKAEEVAPSPTPELVEPTPSPTPDPMADWNVYEDSEQGIEFKYPGTWYATRYEPLTFSVFLDAAPIKIPEASEFITPIHIGYNEVAATTNYYQEATLAEGVERYKGLFESETVEVKEDVIIDGKEAAIISGDLGPGMFEGEYFEYVLIQMEDKLLVAQLWGSQYQQVFDQVLASIKFVGSAENEEACTLSLCDCKCYPEGETREETEGVMCGINCMSEYGVSGCELVDGVCSEI